MPACSGGTVSKKKCTCMPGSTSWYSKASYSTTYCFWALMLMPLMRTNLIPGGTAGVGGAGKVAVAIGSGVEALVAVASTVGATVACGVGLAPRAASGLLGR